MASSRRTLRLGDRDLPFRAGAMHYFRLDPANWAAGLAAIRALGCSAVETYVPWGVHERRRGAFDFSGRRDLGAFLDAAAAAGLHAIVRPGPHINAELAWFGLPERIVSDEKMQARTAQGTPAVLMIPPRGFAVPSYSSRAFLAEVRDWYAAVAEVVAPRLFPAGPVIAIQVDNEHAGFFRGAAYDGDYHPDALAKWGERSFGFDPPRRFEARSPSELAPHLAWLAFREQLAVEALATLRRMLDEVGLGGVPRFHNFPPHAPGIYDVAAAEEVLDFAGIDLYHPRAHYGRIRQRLLYLAGSSRFPSVPELGLGSFPWGPPFTDDDSLHQLLHTVAWGAAGWSLYMAVERDRWYGAPIAEDGSARPLAKPIARLHRALDELGWERLQRQADVGVLVPRGYDRLALASSHAGPVGPAFAEWLGLGEAARARESRFGGLSGPVALEVATAREAISGALDRAHLPWVIVDASAPLDLLRQRRALIVPTFDFLDRALAERLSAFAAAGGQLLTGPRAPSLDDEMAPFAATLAGATFHALTDEALDAAIAALASSATLHRAAPAREPLIDTALHVGARGSALLAVGSRADRPLTGTVVLDRSATAEDLLDGTTLRGSSLSVPLGPFGLRLFRLDYAS